MNRTASREMAFKLVYSLEVKKTNTEELDEEINIFVEDNEISENKVKSYIEDVVKGINKYESEIVALISNNLKEGWEITRISKINLAILKVSVYEMIYKKVPYKVSINEGVELAKNYGDDDSKSFVNGILASIVKEKELDKTEEE